MKREDLKAQGLTDEQIDFVMKENGNDINSISTDLTAKETELAGVKEQLKTANEEIEGFKDLDVEEITKRADKYKTDYEELEQKKNDEIENLKFNHELESLIRDNKAKNVKAVKALLDVETLKGSNNRLEDIKQAIGQIKTDNDYLFTDEAPQGTGGSKGAGGKQDPPTVNYGKQLASGGIASGAVDMSDFELK